jgi:hypothetical protein
MSVASGFHQIPIDAQKRPRNSRHRIRPLIGFDAAMICGREAIYITVSLDAFPAGPKLCTQMLGWAPKAAPTYNA